MRGEFGSETLEAQGVAVGEEARPQAAEAEPLGFGGVEERGTRRIGEREPQLHRFGAGDPEEVTCRLADFAGGVVAHLAHLAT